MLLNKSRAASPSISQHQQGAGDLQIKRSHYLCPPHHHHLDCCPPQHRCTWRERRGYSLWYGASKCWGFFWRGGGILSTFLCWVFSTSIMWSAPCQIWPFINKSGNGGGSGGYADHRGLLQKLHKAAASPEPLWRYGILRSFADICLVKYEIWAVWWKRKSRLHINQELNSSFNDGLQKAALTKKCFVSEICLACKKGQHFWGPEAWSIPAPDITHSVVLHTYQSYLLFPSFSPSCQVGASTLAVGDLALQSLVSPSPNKYGYIWGGNWPAK